eukprot:1265931-Amphidinium_carterae.1
MSCAVSDDDAEERRYEDPLCSLWLSRNRHKRDSEDYTLQHQLFVQFHGRRDALQSCTSGVTAIVEVCRRSLTSWRRVQKHSGAQRPQPNPAKNSELRDLMVTQTRQTAASSHDESLDENASRPEGVALLQSTSASPVQGSCGIGIGSAFRILHTCRTEVEHHAGKAEATAQSCP